jgi:hypothetical protein
MRQISSKGRGLQKLDCHESCGVVYLWAPCFPCAWPRNCAGEIPRCRCPKKRHFSGGRCQAGAEFAAGRLCAARPGGVRHQHFRSGCLTGKRWPHSMVGSITHTADSAPRRSPVIAHLGPGARYGGGRPREWRFGGSGVRNGLIESLPAATCRRGDPDFRPRKALQVPIPADR